MPVTRTIRSRGALVKRCFVASRIEPQILQEIARATDKADKRGPKSFTDALQMGVPGLRQNVPEKFEHGPEDRPLWGKVLAVGPNYKRGVRLGDRVLVGKWAGARVTHHEVEYLIVKPEDILAVDGRN